MHACLLPPPVTPWRCVPSAVCVRVGWRGLVQPAIFTGSLGYAVGTGVGLAVGGVLRP